MNWWLLALKAPVRRMSTWTAKPERDITCWFGCQDPFTCWFGCQDPFTCWWWGWIGCRSHQSQGDKSILAKTVSNIKSFTTHLLQSGHKVLQFEYAKHHNFKISEPASITVPEPPLTENLERPFVMQNTTSVTDSTYLRTASPNDSVPANRGQVATHLPKLTIPMFVADPLDWQPFWDSFEAAIHSDTQLNDAQKLSYLCA